VEQQTNESSVKSGHAKGYTRDVSGRYLSMRVGHDGTVMHAGKPGVQGALPKLWLVIYGGASWLPA